jgi:hypothetical protein
MNKSVFGRMWDVIAAPFRGGKEFMDKRPPARMIRKYAAAVRAAVIDSEVILVVPDADLQIGTMQVPDLRREKPECAEWFVRGYNANMADMANIRRSGMRLALAAQRKAMKLHKIEAKAGKLEREVLRSQPPVGTHAIPPTLSHACGQGIKSTQHGAMGDPAMAGSPA